MIVELVWMKRCKPQHGQFVEGVASLCPLGDAISLLSTVVELGEAWENAYKVESARIEKNNEPNIVTEKRKEAQKMIRNKKTM